MEVKEVMVVAVKEGARMRQVEGGGERIKNDEREGTKRPSKRSKRMDEERNSR